MLNIRSPGKSLRILFWNQRYSPRIGGAEIFTARLAAALRLAGDNVSVVTDRCASDLPENENIDGVAVRRFAFSDALQGDPMSRFRSATGLIAEVNGHITAMRPDLIHLNLSDASPFFLLRSRAAFACPMIATFQAPLTQPLVPGSVFHQIVEHADRIVAVSHAAARNIAQYAAVNVEDIDVIAPGIPSNDFAPASETALPADRPIVTFIGRLVPEKGADTAIRAFAPFHDRAVLRVIGDGPERGSLEALADGLGVAGSVRFTGEVDDATRARLLAQSFVLLVPSRHLELFGMVAAEGSLSGLPVIASRKGGLAEIVLHGDTGFLCDPEDTSAFSAALRLLLDDRDAAPAMGARGRARVLAHLTMEDAAKRYRTLYAECFAQSCRGSEPRRAGHLR